MTTHFTFPGDLESLHDLLDHDGLVDYSELTGTPSAASGDDPIVASENANHLASISESLNAIVSTMDGTEKLFLGTAPMGLQLAGEQPAAQSVPVALATEQIKDKVLQNTVPLGKLGVNACTLDGSVIDCLQYRSIALQIQTVGGSLGQLIFEGSNDGSNFVLVYMYDLNALSTAPTYYLTLAANTNRFYVAPLHYRYFRARVSMAISGGICTVFTILRMVPFIFPATSPVLVSGNVAPGVVASMSPLSVSAVDPAGKTRRFLSDVSGNLTITGPDPTLPGQANPVLVKDVSPLGMSQQDLLWRILIELRSMSHYLKELPLHLNEGKEFSDTVSDFSDEIRIIN